MDLIESTACFGGKNAVHRHASAACSCDMTFGIYLPPQAETTSVPVLWYLSGLTCTHENAMSRAGLQQFAAKRGIALVFPDTSPRGESVADDEAYDLGQGAGFYVNATQPFLVATVICARQSSQNSQPEKKFFLVFRIS